jgi:hypothetical protein
VIACGGDSVTSTDLFGSYTLSTVNGSPLPYSISSTEQVLSDKIVITNDKQWTENGSLSIVQAGQTDVGPFSDFGTVTQTGTEISLYSTDNSQTAYGGTFGKSSMTVTSIGFTFVFNK